MLAAQKLNLRNKLDNTMFNHVSLVSNSCLMIAKKEGVGKEELTKMGKMLWRLFMVLQAYNHKRRDVSLESALAIVSEFKSVFGGE